MTQKELELATLENKYLDGKMLSTTDLNLAAEYTASIDLREAIVSCTAILWSRNAAEEVKQNARMRFEHICMDLSQRDDKYKIEALFSLLQIPLPELLNSQPMKNLAFSALKADRFTLRANAVAVLERLHLNGDRDASVSIEAALQDSNEKVRQNATVALRKKLGS